MPDALPTHPALLPGVEVLRREPGRHLQVGYDPPRRVLLPDLPAVRTLLADLRHPTAGRALEAAAPEAARALHRLAEAGLLVDGDQLAALEPALARQGVRRPAMLATYAAAGDRAAGLLARRRHARITVAADRPLAAHVSRTLREAGVGTVGPALSAADAVLVVGDREPDRDDTDRWMREDVPHLFVRSREDAVVIGPCVVPGRTACLRCLDAHHTDLDPLHPRLLTQHQAAGRDRAADPMLVQLALGWACRDLVTLLDGEQPSTWSATIEIGPDLAPARRRWSPHPRCSCGWEAQLTG